MNFNFMIKKNDYEKTLMPLENLREPDGFHNDQQGSIGWGQPGWTYPNLAAPLYLENHGLAIWDITNNCKRFSISLHSETGQQQLPVCQTTKHEVVALFLTIKLIKKHDQ